jgi:entericidin B
MQEKKMSRVKRIIFSLLLAAAVSCLFAGCHTVKGAGEDIERGGEKIQESAEKHM